MANRTDLDVCNLAVSRIGGEPLEALDESTPLGAYCVANYASKRDELLASYDWRCLTTFAALNRLTPTPAGCPLTYCYAPPADLLGDIRAFRDGSSADACLVRCLVSAVGVASNHGAVWAEYAAAKPAAAWPIWLAQFVAVAFAADLAGRRPDKSLADDLRLEAWGPPELNGQGGKFLAAMQADGRNAPQRTLFHDEPGPLVEARLGGFFPGLSGRPIVVDTSNG